MNRVKSIVGRYWVDVLIVGAAAGLLSIASRAPDPNGAAGPVWLDVLLAVIFVAPLFFRRRWPMAAPFAAIAVVFVGAFADIGFFDNAFPAYLIALGIAVWFGMRPNRREAIAGWAALQLVSVVVTYRDPQTQSANDYFWSLVTFTIAWIIGFALGERLRETDVTRRLAEQAELEREEQARLAVAEERARIARELHDVVGHSVSVMTVQAAAVRRLLEPDQEQGTRGAAGRRADRPRGARRDAADGRRAPAARGGAGLAPQPSLEHLDQLLATHARGRAARRAADRGRADQLPPASTTTAYRLVQEALTNAVKHATRRPGGGRRPLRERHASSWSVSDDGPGDGDGGGSGHGLVGMRERVSVYGGELEAGPQPGGGFRLRATTSRYVSLDERPTATSPFSSPTSRARPRSSASCATITAPSARITGACSGRLGGPRRAGARQRGRLVLRRLPPPQARRRRRGGGAARPGRALWPEDAAVRVRIGIHTGEATLTGDHYVGLAVHRAARICEAGHGGQVLVSETTRSLLEDEEGS